MVLLMNFFNNITILSQCNGVYIKPDGINYYAKKSSSMPPISLLSYSSWLNNNILSMLSLFWKRNIDHSSMVHKKVRLAYTVIVI